MTTASNKTERCPNWVMAGQTVCNSHGGMMRDNRRAGQVRFQRDKAQQEVLQRLKAQDASRHDTITEMDRLAAEAIVWKDVCREMVEQLLELKGEVRYEGKAGEQLDARVVIYERAMDRCNTVLATNVKLGIAERKQKLDEAQIFLIQSAIRAILNRLDLSSEQKVLAVQVVPEELRAVSKAPAAIEA